MAWEYLNTREFDERYKIVAKQLPEGLSVLDMNCGEPRFKKYYKYSKYTANDVFQPQDIKGIDFIKCKDEEVDRPMEILTLFGYGGGEFTGEPLESATAGESLIRLVEKYKPEYVVIEMVRKWEKDFHIMSLLTEKLKKYKMIAEEKIDILPITHYHNKRFIRIFKLPTDAK